MHNKTNNGFTLVEIMIVVAVIAIIMAIAIPNFSRANALSKKTVCINNLKKITAAVEQWALDNNISSQITLTSDQENRVYTDYLRTGKPTCPSGGTYTINAVGSNPQVQCSKESEGHGI